MIFNKGNTKTLFFFFCIITAYHSFCVETSVEIFSVLSYLSGFHLENSLFVFSYNDKV